MHYALTGSPAVTTPNIMTTLGSLNWPMMDASWRNFTLSSPPAPSLRVLTATSTSPSGPCHTPLHTSPNWPEPSLDSSLTRQIRKKGGSNNTWIPCSIKYAMFYWVCALSSSVHIFHSSMWDIVRHLYLSISHAFSWNVFLVLTAEEPG